MIRAATAAYTNTSLGRAFTGRQRSLRRHSHGLPLRRAVRHAARVCFGFTCRAVQGKALWSKTERVWLGKETFFHWSICLPDIDIPWMVATADGAPQDADELAVAVRKELTEYWNQRLAMLPKRSHPAWLPLP